MSTTTHFSWMIILMFILLGVAVVAFIIAKMRRKNQYRGFEVITKPVQEGQEARKD